MRSDVVSVEGNVGINDVAIMCDKLGRANCTEVFGQLVKLIVKECTLIIAFSAARHINAIRIDNRLFRFLSFGLVFLHIVLHAVVTFLCQHLIIDILYCIQDQVLHYPCIHPYTLN